MIAYKHKKESWVEIETLDEFDRPLKLRRVGADELVIGFAGAEYRITSTDLRDALSVLATAPLPETHELDADPPAPADPINPPTAVPDLPDSAA